MLEKIGKIWNKFWYGDEIKKKKVSQQDIQNNIVKIQRYMESIQSGTQKIVEEMEQVDTSTDVGKEKYDRLVTELKTKNELYSNLQKEQEQEYTTLKKMKDSRFGMQPKEAFVVGGLIFLGTFAIALERENPKALKLVSFILKLMPMHI